MMSIILENKKSNIWYLVGLITSDGSLSKDGRHIVITAKDRIYLEELNKLLGLKYNIGAKLRGNDGYRNTFSHYLQFSDIRFYRFLLSIGLTPNKSLTIKSVKAPGRFFRHFLRGLIDGDGCIRSWRHPQNNCEQWSLGIYSGSEDFLKWLSQKIFDLYGSTGRIHSNNRSVKILKFGKIDAARLLKDCYRVDDFCLKRKGIMAKRCVDVKIYWKNRAGML